MIVQIKLQRSEIIPWGFRLTGGAEFEAPLTVTKINENSVAEEHGIKVGDVIVEINGVNITELSHHMVHELITGFTDTFTIGLKRDDAEHVNDNGAVDRPASEMFSEISEMTEHSNADSITDELEATKISEEHIAELISGESEVLKEHNVIGINFQRIIPKANIFKSSEVFKHLNEEAMKSWADKEKEVKRWTTFLQKPNRPIPKPRNQMDIPYQEPYRVRIVKQPKPMCDPHRIPTPPLDPIASDDVQSEDIAEADTIEIEPTDNGDATIESETVTESEEQENEVEDDDVPDLMDCPDEAAELNNDATNETATENGDTEQNDSIAGTVDENGTNDEAIADANNTNTEQYAGNSNYFPNTVDPVLGKQLADVRQQLEALSHLPSTIQATLETITKQIAEIMPALQMRASVDLSASGDDTMALVAAKYKQDNELTSIDADANDDTTTNETTADNPVNSVENESEPLIDTAELPAERPKTLMNRPPIDMIDVLASNVEEQVTKLKIEKCFEAQEEAWEREKEKKDAQHKPTNGDKHQLLAESVAKNARTANRYNGPRTPQERPQVLPGGRKWRNAKDAYNEEFIAEIISSQAELISGSTLGINFLKYKKPEKDLSNLNRSEVFKMIHNTDDQRPTGIALRPPKVLAVDDFSHVGCP